MKATINKSGLDTEVSPIDGGKYYITQDGDVYRADDITLQQDGQMPNGTAAEEHQVTIIISGDNGTIRQTMEAIMYLVNEGQKFLEQMAQRNSKQNDNNKSN